MPLQALSTGPTRSWRRILWLCGCLLLCMALRAGAQDAKPETMPVAENGRLELGAWDLSQNGPIPLSGAWEFYWEKLLTPADFTSGPAKSGFITVPGSWRGFQVNDKPIGAYGYATYRLIVHHPPQTAPLALKVTTLFTASRLFINGKQVFVMGRPGTSKATSVPDFYTRVVSFIPQGETTEIILQVSNFHGKHGGAKLPILFGLDADISALRNKAVAMDMFQFGTILIMGIYFLVHFSFRPKEQALLFFGLLCVIIAIRLFVTGEQFISDAFPGVPWGLVRRCDYLSICLGVPVFLMFFQALFPQEVSKYALRGVQIVMGVLALVIVVTPETIYGQTLEIIEAVTVLTLLYLLVALVVSLLHKRRGAVLFLLGFSLLFLSVIMDILQNLRLIDTPLMLGYGLIAFIFSQALVIAYRFSRAYDAIEAQAQEIQTMGQEVAEGRGDLTKRLAEADGEDDEISTQSHWFNQFLATLDATFGGVKESSASVDTAADEVATGTQGLSQSVQSQAAAVEEVAATIEEMSTTIRRNAGDAQAGREEVREMVNLANDASQVAQDLIRRMGEMSGASRKINDIIVTVNEVAFQTNLLALNAAVEAARAGEHGKGFAVVAGEVRSLAQRSADAAKEIKALIEDTVGKIAAGDEMAKRSVAVIAQILGHVESIARTMEGMAVSSSEQSGGIDEISRAIGAIDLNTQQNAATAEELSCAAERLRAQARELAEIVARFTVSGYGVEAYPA